MLTLNDVFKHFPGNYLPTLKGITLEFKKGEFCIVVGSNGSGKSTLLKTIAGEYSITRGSIKINGKELHCHTAIASVTQNIHQGLIPTLTILENVILGLNRKKTAQFYFYKKYRPIIFSLLQSLNMGLEEKMEKPLSVLSGGQQQAIALLMALCSKPEILLLDEHTSALDPKTQHHLMTFTAKSVESQQLTTIMITHKLEDAVRYGNRLIMLHDGNVVLDVKGKEKENITSETLLGLFHHHEDFFYKGKQHG